MLVLPFVPRKGKIVIVSVLFFLALLPEIITLVSSTEWKNLFVSVFFWLTNNYSFLLQLIIIGIALLLLYGFFAQGKVWPLFNQMLHYRVVTVILIGTIELSLIYNFWFDIKGFINTFGGEKPNWLGAIITTLLASPIAFIIWSFRNTDKRKDLQHAEENIRQADFHKIEEWATTFLSVSVQEAELSVVENKVEHEENTAETPANTNKGISTTPKIDEAKTGVLQIAAIYQLLPYLKGEYGSRFVRPAMEIYRSLLSSWRWSEEETKEDKIGPFNRINVSPYITALHTIFRQESEFFGSFHKKPVCIKNKWIPLKDIDLKGVILIDADLRGANLHGANLIRADLTVANLSGTNLCWVDLSGASLVGANLMGAKLSWANLRRTNFRGANLSGAIYLDTQIETALMDEKTILRDGSYWKPPEYNADTDNESKSY